MTQEWRFVDKSGWGEGPWNEEPDKIVWTDEATGLPCMIRRHPDQGNLCGYVAVAEGHPAFNRDREDIPVSGGHRGLTYSAFCEQGEPELGLCHIPEPGAPVRVWWLGFDCGHAFDLSPGTVATLRKVGVDHSIYRGETYRDVPYVRECCRELAAELQAMIRERE